MSLGISAQSEIDHWYAIFQDGSEWDFLIPSAQPPWYWMNPDFEAEGWEEGTAGFGYNDGDDETVVESTTSIYLRHEFEIDDLSIIDTALFYMDYDDGIVNVLDMLDILTYFGGYCD